MDINKLNQLLNQSKLTQEIGEEEDIIAERPADLGGQGRFPATLPNPVDTEEEINIVKTPARPESDTEVPAAAIPAPQSAVAPITKQMVTGETQTITSVQKAATPGVRQAQQDQLAAIELEGKAQEELLKAQQIKAEAAFKLNQEAQRIEAEAAAREKEVRDAAQQEYTNRLNELDNKVAALSEQKYEGYWDNKSTGTKVLGAISLALGAFSSAYGGGPNTALAIINKAMDDDFKQYQDKVANKIKAIDKSKLNLETKNKLVNEQILGLQAKKQSDIRVIQNKITNLENKFSNPEIKAKLQQLNAQLDQKLAQTRLAFEKDLGEQTNTQFKDEQALRKEVASDPVIQNATKTLVNVATADNAMDLVRKGDAGALGTVTTLIASSIQSGVLSDRDIARASGAPLGIVQANLDRIDTWIMNQPPEKQIATLEDLLKTTRQGAETQLQARNKYYTDIAKDRGFKVENVIAPAPKQREAAAKGSGKQPVRKQHNRQLGKTKITYSDGSVEVLDGLK